jgi:hypothetical protein
MDHPIKGDSNVMCVLKFTDGIKWVLRIPFNGTRGRFTPADALRLRSHALAMIYLKKHTNIPIPDIYDFKTDINDSEIGMPYTLMSFVDGVPLGDRWFDKTAEPAVLRDRRIRILESIAKAMAQLHGLEFPKIGELQFSDPPILAVTDITKYDVKDVINNCGAGGIQANLADCSGGHRNPDCSALHSRVHTYRLGPFSTTQDFFIWPFSVQHDAKVVDIYGTGMVELLRMMIRCMPASTPSGAPPESFVLAHPNYELRKFLVTDDGTLASIIGWDKLKSVPHCRGYSAYPGWITKDWDPDMYNHTHKERRDSLEDLEDLRREWDRIMSGLLEEDYVPKTHLFWAMSLASESQTGWIGIVTKICSECFEGKPLFEVPAWEPQGDTNLPSDDQGCCSDSYSAFFRHVIQALGSGTLKLTKKRMLEDKFREFFRI